MVVPCLGGAHKLPPWQQTLVAFCSGTGTWREKRAEKQEPLPSGDGLETVAFICAVNSERIGKRDGVLSCYSVTVRNAWKKKSAHFLPETGLFSCCVCCDFWYDGVP